MTERNEHGQVLVYVLDAVRSANDDFTRYNGGWVKRIDGIDKSKTTGYSLLGEFIDGAVWLYPGQLLLDCSKGGSRKNQIHVYTLLRVEEDGSLQALYSLVVKTREERRTWAVKLWPVIEKNLARPPEREGKQERNDVCKNCRHWNDGICWRIEIDDSEPGAADAVITWEALDDSGLSVMLKTGPMFSCSYFERREESRNV